MEKGVEKDESGNNCRGGCIAKREQRQLTGTTFPGMSPRFGRFVLAAAHRGEELIVSDGAVAVTANAIAVAAVAAGAAAAGRVIAGQSVVSTGVPEPTRPTVLRIHPGQAARAGSAVARIVTVRRPTARWPMRIVMQMVRVMMVGVVMMGMVMMVMMMVMRMTTTGTAAAAAAAGRSTVVCGRRCRLDVLYDLNEAVLSDPLEAAGRRFKLGRKALLDYLQPLGKERSAQEALVQRDLLLYALPDALLFAQPAFGHQLFVKRALLAQ